MKAWNNILKEYSDGINAAAARILLRQMESRPREPAAGAVRTNNIGMDLVYISPGEFVMGSKNGNSDEKPTRTVTIRKGFWM